MDASRAQPQFHMLCSCGRQSHVAANVKGLGERYTAAELIGGAGKDQFGKSDDPNGDG
jgi:hypothetical protein